MSSCMYEKPLQSKKTSQDGEINQLQMDFSTASSSQCNNGGYIPQGDSGSYSLTGIPSDSPSLTFDQILQSTPVSNNNGTNEVPAPFDCYLSKLAKSSKSVKTKIRNSKKSLSQNVGKSARRSLKLGDGVCLSSSQSQDSSTTSDLYDVYAASGYQYLPLSHSRNFTNPSFYYNSFYSSGYTHYADSYSAINTAQCSSSPLSWTPIKEEEETPNDSKLCKSLSLMNCESTRTNESIISPISCNGSSESYNSAFQDSGISVTDRKCESPVSDSYIIQNLHANADGGSLVGPPLLFIDQSEPTHERYRAFCEQKNKILNFYCAKCVSLTVTCQTESGSDVQSASNFDRDICDSLDGCCQQHCLVQDVISSEQEKNTQSGHLCFGCQKPVFDRYILHVKDHGYWHAECLKCSNCQDNLSTQKSCYVKNEQVFCRNDYNILFGLSCVKCSLQFKKEQDWMRVAGQHRYHIACFLCKICKRQLGNNEKYHLVNGTDIYCTNHYRDMVNGDSSDGQQPPKKAKRNRTSYTETQIKFLQDRFLRDSNPDGSELEKIAKHIGLKKRVVQVWFQNNRARLKKSANNVKGSNQENKNPSTSNGITGPGSMHDFQTMDWDNSMDPKSLDDQSYSNSPHSSHPTPGSSHFLDSAYSMNSALSSALSTPLMCMPPGHGTSSSLGNGPPSLGDGSPSGGSTCATPRDQASPQFSDLSTPALNTTMDSGTEDAPVSVAQDFPSLSCTAPRHTSLLQGRMFHDGAPLHRQLHHPEPLYGNGHPSLYNGFYGVACNESLCGDAPAGSEGYLRHMSPNPHSIFSHDINAGVSSPSSPLCNVGFTGGQNVCTPPDSPQMFKAYLNYLPGYGRSTCHSPSMPNRQSSGQFQFLLNANNGGGNRNKMASFLNDSSEGV